MASDLVERLQLRCVTEADYDKVMAVRENVYGGQDYLPSCFHILIKASNSMAFAAELNGRFIAFTISFIIDDGQTVVERASRVSEEYEGRGVMRWLQQQVEVVIMERTSVKYVTYTTERTVEGTHRQLKLGKCYSIVDRDMIHFSIERSELNRVMQNMKIDDLSRFQRLNCHNLEQVFNSTKLSNQLFGAERILINWLPYKPIKSNIPFMIDENTTVIGSNLHNEDKALLTFCYSFEVTLGMMNTIDVYGNVDDLSTHILLHIQDVKLSKMRDQISVELVYKGINDEIINKLMSEIKFSSNHSGTNGILGVERIIR